MGSIYLGLDVSSTSTGWAVLKSGRFYKREGIDYGLIRPHKDYTLPEKLNFFRDELSSVIRRVEPTSVGIEDVFLSRNVKTLKLLARFSGVAIESVYEFTKGGLFPYIVQVRNIRAECWGTQDKKEVFETVVDKYKLENWSFNKYNDVTDAITIALYISRFAEKK